VRLWGRSFDCAAGGDSEMPDVYRSLYYAGDWGGDFGFYCDLFADWDDGFVRGDASVACWMVFAAGWGS